MGRNYPIISTVSRPLLLLLDGFFFAAHTLLILINVFGGLFERTRRLNLITICFTAMSWIVLGYWFGWGYCICTHWHWEVRRALGIHDAARSYNQLLVYKISGWLPAEELTSNVAATIFLVAILIQVIFGIRKIRQRVTTKG